MKLHLKEYVLVSKQENENELLINVDVDEIVDILISNSEKFYNFYATDTKENRDYLCENLKKVKDKNTIWTKKRGYFHTTSYLKELKESLHLYIYQNSQCYINSIEFSITGEGHHCEILSLYYNHPRDTYLIDNSN